MLKENMAKKIAVAGIITVGLGGYSMLSADYPECSCSQLDTANEVYCYADGGASSCYTDGYGDAWGICQDNAPFSFNS